jgi:hypothetical protein
VLDKHPEVQVLWKIKKSGGMTISHAKMKGRFQQENAARDSLEAITNEISSGRIKIVEWLTVNPLSILESGKIICSVYHGGSNSFHEALR